MPKGEYEIFEDLNPFFEVVMEGLRGLVDNFLFVITVFSVTSVHVPDSIVTAWAFAGGMGISQQLSVRGLGPRSRLGPISV